MSALLRTSFETQRYAGLIIERVKIARNLLEAAESELARIQEECGIEGHTAGENGCCESCLLSLLPA